MRAGFMGGQGGELYQSFDNNLDNSFFSSNGDQNLASFGHEEAKNVPAAGPNIGRVENS